MQIMEFFSHIYPKTILLNFERMVISNLYSQFHDPWEKTVFYSFISLQPVGVNILYFELNS